MLDFVTIKQVQTSKGVELYADFRTEISNDLMTRGKTFYAVWDEEAGLWSTDEYDIVRMIDGALLKEYNKLINKDYVRVKWMKDFSSKCWSEWQKYVKSRPDAYHELDDRIKFANDKVKKRDYVTRRLPYKLEDIDTPAYNEMMSVLYDEKEREKIEWAIGSIIKGESMEIQKFIVLYGGPGTGKSTILNIIQKLFPDYYSSFDSKALSRSNNSFALEAFSSNPLIAIEHDGDLSHIEDNTRLNSIVSHEKMTVNEKFKSIYTTKFKTFLFMGTNKPVKITDAKSGILRRLIDVQPTGTKIPRKKFDQLYNQIDFELGGIAYRCLKVYESLGKSYYDSYIPILMMSYTNDFFDFVEENYDFLRDDENEGISLSVAWKRYQSYCEESNVSYPLSRRVFREELRNYYQDFKMRSGTKRSVYFGFRHDKLNYNPSTQTEPNINQNDSWIKFDRVTSDFDKEFLNRPAQYANKDGIPSLSWVNCKTKLRDIDPSELHYVLMPSNVIVIDFDIKGEDGNKSFERNLEEASKWTPTYAELSKSGSGIHLHYVYDGDPSELSRIYGENVEIKVFTGKSSLRRKLTKCNNLPIAKISTGLPLKETKKVLNEETLKSEKGLRDLIIRNLHKEIHPNTKPSIDFIYKILDDAYNQGLKYDVRDMRPAIQNFALGSTNQADACLKLVSKMKFCSEEGSEDYNGYKREDPLVFVDIEIFPNLFIVCWKKEGPNQQLVKWINPCAEQIEVLVKSKLVGYNNRRYDNHILYARMMGYSNEQLFRLSQRIVVDNDQGAMFSEAYNLSYTDVYDFLSAPNKMSLKKWEIKLGIHHQEFPLPWDQPVPEDKWELAADYCGNDVIATEAVFLANQPDWLAREILAEWAETTVNDTTNNCTTKIIVGKDRNPQSQYVYTDLSTIFPGYRYDPYGIPKEEYNEGTKIVSGKSIYRGEDPGEGGYVYANPGIYYNAAVLDVASMHPHSAIALNIFGDTYTLRFANIVKTRIYIKHKEYDKAKEILPHKLHKYLDDPSMAKNLANALKTAINSVYGLTSARFPNKLKDPRNVDNIVAKYGALFMINLKHEVQDRGFTVIHIKTDSIKIANATSEIIEFVMEYGRKYGYTFEHECTYERICLVNDAVYIAKVGEEDSKKLDQPYWTATGAQFQVPYVFKTLFSKDKILFDDLCETKSVTSAMYLDFNEGMGDDKHDYRFVGKVGLFCPVVDGVGGAFLLRESSPGKYSAVVGTKKPGKGDLKYRWMEAEMVLKNRLQDQIDRSYYNKLVDDAIDTINKYGDFEQFVSDDVDWMRIPDGVGEEGIPFEECINPPCVA